MHAGFQKPVKKLLSIGEISYEVVKNGNENLDLQNQRVATIRVKCAEGIGGEKTDLDYNFERFFNSSCF